MMLYPHLWKATAISEVDKFGLAYYRYDWVLQEFCDYGERVFLSNELSDHELRVFL